MDHGAANLAFETAGMLVRMLLFRRGVTHPAIGAGEVFGRPYPAAHLAKVPLLRRDCSHFFKWLQRRIRHV